MPETEARPAGSAIPALLQQPRTRKTATALASVLGFYWLLQAVWPAPIGVLVQGLVIGGLIAMIAFGLALVHRSNRIINFAQGDLGAVPASLAVLLIVGPGWPYFLALPVGIATAIVLGGLIEFVLIRRFFRAPRLILTVVTIGVSQLLAFAGFVLPAAFDIDTPPQSFPSPFDFQFAVGQTLFTGNDIMAMLAVIATLVGLAAFFRFTSIGVAVRAAAESPERASLLGIPVKRLETVVWVLAAVLSATAVFLRAGIVGLPFGQLLGPAILVQALAAAVIGRMERLPTIFVASLAIGVLESAIIFSTGSGVLVTPILFVIITVTLLVQRRAKVARGDESLGLQGARDPRPIPRELLALPEVRYGLLAARVLPVLLALSLPLFMSEPDLSLASVILITATVAVSLVVLSGWAGQVSLGQVGFMGVGAAAGGYLTTVWQWDLSLAILASGLVGAAVAMLIGLPALRIRGLLLSVTTLSFALMTSTYLLNPGYFPWLPVQRFERPLLFGAISLETETRYFYFSLAGLALAVFMVRGLHASRAGRVLVAVRDNERAAQSYGVNATRAKLMGFAVSGFIAAYAGAIFVHHQQALGTEAYSTAASFAVFIMAVIGGLGSVAGAILGAVFIVGIQYFRDVFPASIADFLAFLTSGVGLIVVLFTLPGGFGQLLFDTRDRLLRKAADRRGLHVPSLLRDSRLPDGSPQPVDQEPPPGAEGTLEDAEELTALVAATTRSRKDAS
jgi:branched-chain amino acid transport system permease protein